MAAADTARLVASLTLDPRGFTRGLSAADKALGKTESTAFRVGQNIGNGAKAAVKSIALIGVAAGAGIAVAVKGGLADLATLETAITSVDGAIKQFGLSGEISGKEVAKWANDIERDIGAAFDDKDITAAAATLIRFGKVTPKNLKQALEVMTDLAAKTGDVESASTLLAKALADPAKAAGKLSRQGIILTKAQQDQVKAMLEVNDTAGAQALLLDIVAKSTSGAAAASQGKYARALSVLNDVAEDSRKALAEGFLPVIEKVADKLSTALANPAFINGLRDFGQELAGGLDDLISIAEKLPWATIGDSLKIAGAGAKAVLQAFTSLPPWVQTAVLTGWGLNKLTGGALGGIVGELGKGLIKGVLGMNAGVVNIKAATVTGVGGAPVGGGPAGGGIGGKVAAGATIAAGVGVLITQEEIGKGIQQGFAQALGGSPLQVEIAGRLPSGLNLSAPIDRLQRALSGDFRSELEVIQDLERGQTGEVSKLNSTFVRADGAAAVRQNASNERLEAIRGQQATASARAIADSASERAVITASGQGIQTQQMAAAARAAGDSSSERASIAAAAAAQTAAQGRTTAAAHDAAAAIRDKDLSVKVSNYTTFSSYVSISSVIKNTLKYKSLHKVAS